MKGQYILMSIAFVDNEYRLDMYSEIIEIINDA